MAAAVLSQRTAEWTSPKITVDSAGTGAWHIGQGPHPTSQKVWESAGYRYTHSARQFQSSDFFDTDLILVMDSTNFSNVIQLASNDESRDKVFYLRNFDVTLKSVDPNSGDYFKLEIPDPYNQTIRAYQETLSMVERAVDGLLLELKNL
jgi:protein-tyrosine phosphatase